MSYRTLVLVLAGLASIAPAALCDINVGDIFLISDPNGTTQFFLDNFTGITDGCSTPGGFPVCTDLSISGTLTYSYVTGSSTVNGTATLATAIGTDDQNGGQAYAPLNFLFPSTDILSASFSGFLTPSDFSTDVGPLDFNGIVESSSDVVEGGGYALLTTGQTITTVTPEPSSYLFLSSLLLGNMVLAAGLAKRRRARISRQ